MKKICFIVIMILTGSTVFGQVQCGGIAAPEDWNFDDGVTWWDYQLFLDTVSHSHNIWQTGAPHKTVISGAYSSPHVIITDTINHYPPNDTSVIIFRHMDMGGYSTPHSAELAGYYNVNSDSLHDYGTIEISLNHGTSWINLITDTTYSSYYYWLTPKPTLTGNSNGWVNFWVSLSQLGSVFPVNMGDTILLKFTFISDSISDTLDGLAYDNFQFCDGVEGIDEIINNNLIDIYPNPVSELLYINRRTQPENESVQIYDFSGQLLFEDKNFRSTTIDTRKINLADGIYFLKYSDMKRFAFKKFIIQQ